MQSSSKKVPASCVFFSDTTKNPSPALLWGAAAGGCSAFRRRLDRRRRIACRLGTHSSVRLIVVRVIHQSKRSEGLRPSESIHQSTDRRPAALHSNPSISHARTPYPTHASDECGSSPAWSSAAGHFFQSCCCCLPSSPRPAPPWPFPLPSSAGGLCPPPLRWAGGEVIHSFIHFLVVPSVP